MPTVAAALPAASPSRSCTRGMAGTPDGRPTRLRGSCRHSAGARATRPCSASPSRSAGTEPAGLQRGAPAPATGGAATTPAASPSSRSRRCERWVPRRARPQGGPRACSSRNRPEPPGPSMAITFVVIGGRPGAARMCVTSFSSCVDIAPRPCCLMLRPALGLSVAPVVEPANSPEDVRMCHEHAGHGTHCRAFGSQRPRALPPRSGSMNGLTTPRAPSSVRAMGSSDRAASAAYPRSHRARSGTVK